MSCSGSHLGITINIKNTKFVKDLPMIDAQFRFNQCNSFREEYILYFLCNYMAMSSLTYILGFSVRFFQPVYSV
jgi:hypothetical protein